MRSTRQPRLRGEQRQAKAEELQAKYYAGSSIRSLADQTGYSYGTVRNLLLLAGTRLRKRGGGLPRPVPELDR
ncbi:helix-turn-helix domain-containing protein [Streptomyces sp. NBC_00425]|uniref:helix-turn-helix domain-containing protein n=1 Tax=Streptomyces sp. NBC_00425 TaxID=2975740 RepID=UPI002E24FCEE